MEQMNDLRTLLKHDVMMLQSAEEQIIEALPAMMERASNPDLKEALREHLRITQQQRQRLNQVQGLLGADEDDVMRHSGLLANLMGGMKCKGMAGIISEGEKMMAEDMSDEVMDAAIIGGSQKIEHFEIACYGTAKTYARQLGLEEVERLLAQTLQEEKEADERLTMLAESGVNQQAEAGALASASSNRY